MKGIDLTEQQLAAARQFLNEIHHGVQIPDSEREVMIPFVQLTRVVAWYGAIRADAALKGATAENPGEVFCVRSDGSKG